MITAQENYVPKLYLTVYQDEGQNKVYVEETPIVAGRPLAAQPLSVEAANRLGKALYQQSIRQISGLIPPELVHIGWKQDKAVLTWYSYPAKHKMIYTKNLKIPNGTMAVPSMIWQWNDHNRELKVFAVYGWTVAVEAMPKVKLYHAPFHNVYPDGRVCIGTGDRHIQKAETFRQLMNSVTKVFWGTEFSALHNTDAVNGNLNTLHHSLITTAAKEFPNDKLIETGKTLNDIL